MTAISASTINRPTVLHGIKTSSDDWVTGEELCLILQAPEGYPVSGVMHNLLKSKVINKRDSAKTSARSGRALKEFQLNEKGHEYLAQHADQIQEFGNYKIIPTKEIFSKKSDNKQPSLPLVNEPKFSATVMAAMKEVEEVGTINENAHTCIEGIKRSIESYRLKNNNDNLSLSGALAAVQDETRALNIIINNIEKITSPIER
jgi:hypothetical protein